MKILLNKYPEEKVNIFIGYLEKLKAEKDKDGKSKNWWFEKVSEKEYANAFIKVASTGLFIDGDTITLNYRKQIVITYDYHAYQNKILLTYPETIFDFGIVHKEDMFSVSKESGKVIYSHKITNPFAGNKDIIGAYGVLKNSKGEFIETINLKDIEKMKNSSKMGFIWNTWFDRMVLKSIIKRLCAAHFKDLIKDIDGTDNLQNDPNRAEVDEKLLLAIDEAETVEQLNDIYTKNQMNIADANIKKQFINILADRKKEVTND